MVDPLVPVMVTFEPPVHCPQIVVAEELMEAQVRRTMVTDALDVQLAATGSLGSTGTRKPRWKVAGELAETLFEVSGTRGTTARITPAATINIPTMRMSGRRGRIDASEPSWHKEFGVPLAGPPSGYTTPEIALRRVI
ncbi:MAG: hypothetical protein WB873_02335 [Thermoplasmata archaeon]